jgi:oxygen-independent coproporphyrinogen-3 oxidase
LRRVLSGQSPVAQSESLAPEDRARELLVLGLRRMQGVDRSEFRDRSGYEIDQLIGAPLAQLVSRGLLNDDGLRLWLSREGLFVSDAIWPSILRT